MIRPLKTSIAFALVSFGSSLPVSAQQASLPEISVYGSHAVPVEASRAGTAVTVITAEDMARQGVQTLPQALRLVPGLAVNVAGGAGGLTQVRMRGAEANQARIFIDGVPVNNVADGDLDYAGLPVADIDRIEVLRGPQSSLYGANAMAGAILIMTKSGRGLARPQAEAALEAGGYGTARFSANARGSQGAFYGSISAQGDKSDGYNTAFVGNRADGSNGHLMALKLGLDPNENVNIEGSFRRQFRSADYHPQDGTTGLLLDGYGRTETTATTGQIAATFKLLEGRWIHRLSADLHAVEAPSVSAYVDSSATNTTTSSWTKTQRSRFGYRTSLSFDAAGLAHTLSLGVENQTERYANAYYADFGGFPYTNTGFASGVERRSTGLYAEHLIAFEGGTTLSAALRRDFNTIFADATTWRGTLSQPIWSGARLHASIGRGVTNPTFFEQYGYSNTFVGNPGLQPESSTAYDIGLEQSLAEGRAVADLTFFRASLTNEITGSGNTAINLPFDTYRQGLEARLALKPVDRFDITFGYTYTDTQSAELVSGTYYFNEALRRPRHSGAVSANARFLDNRLTAGVTLAYNGQMRDRIFSDPTRNTNLTPYTLLGAQASYAINDNLTAYMRGENLLNQTYQEVYGYRSPGATVYAGLKARL